MFFFSLCLLAVACQKKGGKTRKENAHLAPLMSPSPPSSSATPLPFLPPPFTAPQGRTGEAFMKIAKAGNIHSFCHPNSLLTLKEWVDDYAHADEKEAEMIKKVIDTESASDEISAGAKRLLKRKMAKVEAGERDVYV